MKETSYQLNWLGSNGEPQRAPKTKAESHEGKLGFVTGLNLWTHFKNHMVRRQALSAIKLDMLGRNGWKINKGILLHPISSTEMEECFSPDTTAQTPAICRHRGFQ